MLFLQFVPYSSSFVDKPKNEIPGAALELWQLKIKQFSYYMVPCTSLFIFHAGSRRLGFNNFRNSSYKEKRPVRPVFPIFPFLMVALIFLCSITYISTRSIIVTWKCLKKFIQFYCSKCTELKARFNSHKAIREVQHIESTQRYTYEPSVTLKDGSLYISHKV